jgi:hypothetical protein
LVIDAGVEEDVVLHDLVELGPIIVEGDPAEAAPMERHGPAAMRDDQLERRKVLEEVRQDQLHERHGVGVEVIRAGRVLRRIATSADVNHRRHVELDHLLVERIPPLVGQRRGIEISTGRVGVEVAADEPHLHAALQLAD